MPLTVKISFSIADWLMILIHMVPLFDLMLVILKNTINGLLKVKLFINHYLLVEKGIIILY